MQRRFTDDDIIRFLYEELNPSEHEAFLKALCLDEALWERYEHFQSIVQELDGTAPLEPSSQSVEQVMEFARQNTDTIPLPQPTPKKVPLWARIPRDLPVKMVAAIAFLMFMSVAITGSIYTIDQRTYSIDADHSLVESDYDPRFEWDDSELDQQLQEISNQVEQLQAKEVL